jgi:hypothetical protein
VTQPVPEESNEALDVTEQPPGTHDDDLPDEGDSREEPARAEENAESSLDQPSDASD